MKNISKKNFFQQKIKIKDIIKKYVRLKNIGSNYLGLCPFHKETIPSFFIRKNFYICYGCGSKGNIINFLSKIMNISYNSTVFYLYKKQNISTIKKNFFISSLNLCKIRLKYVINIIQKYFQNNLFKYKNICLKYLLKYRQISFKAIVKYSLGYGGISQKKFFLYLQKNNILLKEACEIGLLIYFKRWKYIYLNRIIFPIKNVKGEVISFIGRIFFQIKYEKKYLNCLNNIIYNKNKTFFGFFETVTLFNKAHDSYIIIVEGLFDTLSLYEMNNLSVSLNGKNISIFQVNIIKKFFSSKIVLCLDNDKIGLKASLLVLKKCLQYNILTFLLNSFFKDPNEILKNKKIVSCQIKYPIDFIENIMYQLFFHINNSKNSKIIYMHNLLKIIYFIKDNRKQEYYLSKVKFILNMEKKIIKKKYSLYKIKRNIFIPSTLIINYFDKFILIIFRSKNKISIRNNFTKILLNFGSLKLKFFLLIYGKLFQENCKNKIHIENIVLYSDYRKQKILKYFFYLTDFPIFLRSYNLIKMSQNLKAKVYYNKVLKQLLYFTGLLLS